MNFSMPMDIVRNLAGQFKAGVDQLKLRMKYYTRENIEVMDQKISTTIEEMDQKPPKFTREESKKDFTREIVVEKISSLKNMLSLTKIKIIPMMQ